MANTEVTTPADRGRRGESAIEQVSLERRLEIIVSNLETAQILMERHRDLKVSMKVLKVAEEHAKDALKQHRAELDDGR